MFETFPCTFADCGRVFSKAFELRKHKATHDNPDRVHHCSICGFITLQKKNLAIHIATHTGEKRLECPETVTVGDSKLRCDYRTHDPASLSKHRRKVHDYVPPPTRGRPKARPFPYKAPQKREEAVHRRRKRPMHAVVSPRRKVSRSPRKPRSPEKGRGDISTFANRARFSPLENATDIEYRYGCEAFEGDSSVALAGSDDEMRMDTLFDPSLRSEWMARYEIGYSTFATTGMKYKPAPLPADSTLGLPPDVSIGWEACLCPEWMVEVGIEGWDQHVLQAHNDLMNV